MSDAVPSSIHTASASSSLSHESAADDDTLLEVSDASAPAVAPVVTPAVASAVVGPDDATPRACETHPTVEQQRDILLADENIDKRSAISILRLHHAMEIELIRTTFEKEKIAASSSFERDSLRTSRAKDDMFLSVTADIKSLNERLAEVEERFAKTDAALSSLSGAVQELQMFARGSKRK